MIHSIMMIFMACGILLVVVGLWFMVYYWLNPMVKDPDGRASITGQCGDTMEINLKFKDGRVINASCWTDGCVHSLNSVCAAADMAKGKSPDDIVQIDAGLIQESVGGLPQDHLHCAQLAAETLQAALEDYMIRSVRNGKR